MLKKINTLPRKKRQYLYRLQSEGKLKRYLVDGRVAYDTDEEKERKAKAIVGRPAGNKVKIERSDDE